MKRVTLRCGCVVEGDPPNVRRIWLCKRHSLEEKAKGRPLIEGQIMKVGGDVHE